MSTGTMRTLINDCRKTQVNAQPKWTQPFVTQHRLIKTIKKESHEENINVHLFIWKRVGLFLCWHQPGHISYNKGVIFHRNYRVALTVEIFPMHVYWIEYIKCIYKNFMYETIPKFISHGRLCETSLGSLPYHVTGIPNIDPRRWMTWRRCDMADVS